MSSGEAEYYGIVQGSSVGMGVQSVLRDLGLNVKLQVLTDSSAAKGIASQRGLGKVRHVEVSSVVGAREGRRREHRAEQSKR